jgi:hypothetical protein
MMSFRDGAAVMIDHGTKFFDSVVFRGWFTASGARLDSVELLLDDKILAIGQLIDQYSGVPATGEYYGWHIQSMLPKDANPNDLSLRFRIAEGRSIVFAAEELIAERHAGNAAHKLTEKFLQAIDAAAYTKVLDLGGRDRSEMGVWLYKAHHQVTVFDIIDAPGVNVVGDAHHVSEQFPAGFFDVVFCNAVMEHIAMPWKVATELSKVMRVGGLGFFHTHQTLGMHDRPWDFWRFSDTAWDAIFNEYTGFEIVDRALGGEMFIIPFAWRQGPKFEEAAGYESSCVLVRKIGDAKVDWPVKTKDIIKNMYPTG